MPSSHSLFHLSFQENGPDSVFHVWMFFFLFLIIHNCLRVYKFVSMNACSCVCAGGSQLNKQTLSLEKLSGCLKHLASIQGTLQFCVFNSQLCNCLHHTCCTQKGGGWGWGGVKRWKKGRGGWRGRDNMRQKQRPRKGRRGGENRERRER